MRVSNKEQFDGHRIAQAFHEFPTHGSGVGLAPVTFEISRPANMGLRAAYWANHAEAAPDFP
jgi:hypothetical protein